MSKRKRRTAKFAVTKHARIRIDGKLLEGGATISLDPDASQTRFLRRSGSIIALKAKRSETAGSPNGSDPAEG